MSNMMIYATPTTLGGNVESVWGYKMQVRTIDSSDKEAVDKAKADGWTNSASDVIDQIEALSMKAENDAIKSQLPNNDDKKRITELEGQVAKALTEVANLEAKLAIYEETKDTNGDGVVSYDELTNDELRALLDQRKVEYGARDSKDVLINLAQDSE